VTSRPAGIGHGKAWRQAWHHRINHHHAGKPKPPPNQPVSCFNRKPKRPKEQREKREQREERANEKKREKFSEEMRGEREKIGRNISCRGWGQN
jgi:hypothetical protein